jgi:hypothetical protein
VLDGEPRIARVMLDHDGTHAYVERLTSLGGSNFAINPVRRIDLRTGAVEELDARIVSAATRDQVTNQPVMHRYLMLDNDLVDTSTGQAPAIETSAALREARRAATPLRTATGRRLWVRGGKIAIENEDGSVRIVEPERPIHGFAHGLGISAGGGQFFDPFRQRLFNLARRGMRDADVRIRPGAWLLRKKRNEGAWKLYDPEAETWADARGLDAADRVAAILEDGRVFVVRRHGNLDLLRPETGQWDAVVYENGRRVQVQPTWHGFVDAGGFGVGGVPARTPKGARIFLADGIPARFDVEANRLTRVGFSAQEPVVVLGSVNETTVFVRIGNWGIARAQFGAGDGCHVIYREQ